jgi:hypothetical protein
MRTWFWCALALAAAMQQAGAQEQAAGAAPQAEAASTEAPQPIFNGQLRRYRFALEGTLVTTDTAEAFVIQYQKGDRPRIFGAYPDDEHNALVVVAGPEAEQAIRENLAEWIIAGKGIELGPSLKGQRRAIEFRWRTLVCAMAEVEVELVSTTGERAQQLRERLRQYEAELTTVEKQLQVLDRYLARLAAGPGTGQ